MSRLASHRFKRRALWIGALVASVVGVVVAAALIGNTAEPEPEHFSSQPAWVYHEPKLARLGRAERARLLETSMLFVRTAVARRDLDRAYALAGPELRQGMSRSEWAKGNIPVVPFPAVGVAQWNVAYSYENDVAFQISLIAERGASPVVGKTFTIELVRPSRSAPWHVASWVPTGISGAGNDLKVAAQARAVQARTIEAPLGRIWLALPVGVLALVILIPIGVATRSWFLNRRGEREYRLERGRSL